MNNKPLSQYDVIISGGGLSGLLTAVGLLNETPDLSIAIVEPVPEQGLSSSSNTATNGDDNTQLTQAVPKADFNQADEAVKQAELKQASGHGKSNFDQRCLALSYGSLQLLQHWQIWSKLKPLAWPIKTIITSDRGHVGKTLMRAQQYQLNAMGYVAAMHNMGKAFTDCLRQIQQTHNKQVAWYRPNTIEHIDQSLEHITVTLNDNQQLQAKLMVVAEGGQSPSRQKLNIETSTDEYQQSAIIANIQVSQNKRVNSVLALNDAQSLDGHTAFERFTTKGPIAFLPIDKHQYSVVWSVRPDDVDEIMALSDQDFCQQLQQEFGHSAGVINKVSNRESYPLVLTKAHRIVGDRVVLVGNSAHTIHPIAGQGFNLGLRDVACLVQQVANSVEQNIDIGSFETLNRFEQQRVQDIARITDFTDLLVRVFGLEGRIPALSRTLGLLALQKITSLQQWFALHFMSRKTLNQK